MAKGKVDLKVVAFEDQTPEVQEARVLGLIKDGVGRFADLFAKIDRRAKPPADSRKAMDRTLQRLRGTNRIELVGKPRRWMPKET